VCITSTSLGCRRTGREEKKNKQGRLTQAADGYRPVTRKLDLLMGELGTLKNSSLVRFQVKNVT